MYAIINGKWSHQDGEHLNPVELNQLSTKINSMKEVAKNTLNSDNLLTAFYIIIGNTSKSLLINKLINQPDSTIAIINKKL